MTHGPDDGGTTTDLPPLKLPPWETTPRWQDHEELVRVQVAGTDVARYVDGSGSPAFDSPRPFLHPVRTIGGVTVSDAVPRDHTWHVGLTVGVQDVAGTNLWGGRTYLRGEGYTWRRDHGTITHQDWRRREPGAVRHRLSWRAPDGTVLLDEVRDLAWTVLGPGAWRLELAFELSLPDTATEPVELGSPGSNGRHLGGYGGMAWRLPPCEDVDVRTPLARGEADVHGSRAADGASWLAWSAVTAGAGEAFTIAVAAADPVTAADPWFVRVASYPGIGSSLAWEEPVLVEAGSPLRRAFRFVVADGRRDDEVVAHLLDPEHPPVGDATCTPPSAVPGRRNNR